MRKFYALFTALLALFAINVHADRVLYTENYETGAVPTTWTINGGTGSIAGDAEGKYFSFALGNSNARSAHCLWGESIFDGAKDGLEEYTISVDFQFQAFGNDHRKGQDNGEFAIFSGDKCVKVNGNAGGNWSPFPDVTPNCLFAMTQVSNKDESAGDTDNTHWFINGDAENYIVPEAGTWYTLELTVNVTTREVSYKGSMLI